LGTEYKTALLVSSVENITIFYAAPSTHYTYLATDNLDVALPSDKNFFFLAATI
jgi:hypothetical protein